MKTMAQAMREARLKADISVAELSEMSGVSPNTIWQWEKGRVFPSLITVQAVAHALGMTIDDYIGCAETKTAEWQDDSHGVWVVKRCSSCDSICDYAYPYCPYCGIKMEI